MKRKQTPGPLFSALAAVVLCAPASGFDKIALTGFASSHKVGAGGSVSAELFAFRSIDGTTVTFEAQVDGATAEEISRVYACDQVDPSTCTDITDLALTAPTPPFYSATVALTDSIEEALTFGRVQIVIESSPGVEIAKGEVRVPDILRARGSGGDNVPPTFSLAKFVASLELHPLSGTLSGTVVASALEGGAPVAKICRGEPGMIGPELLTLTPIGLDTWEVVGFVLTADEALDLLDGAMYVQIESGGFPSGEIRGQIRPGYLNIDTLSLSIQVGGRQKLRLGAGKENGGNVFAILGSSAGTAPGIPLGDFVLPLNPDGYFNLLLTNPNSIVAPSIGLLNPAGETTSEFYLPPGLQIPPPPPMNHAYVVIDPLTGIVAVSNPKPLLLVP